MTIASSGTGLMRCAWPAQPKASKRASPARGLLVHWVRLEPGGHDAGTARTARYHVVAPTEWNFHPAGGFASWLASGPVAAPKVRLAAAALDPCVAFTVEEVTHDA